MLNVENLDENYVSFADIVGFSSFADDAKDYMDLIESLGKMMNKIDEDTRCMNEGMGKSNKSYDYGLVGDAICISLKSKESDAKNILNLINATGTLQYCALKEHKLLLQGGIEKGNLIRIDHYLTGSALSRAHSCKSKLNPSYLIVISDDICEYIEKGLSDIFTSNEAKKDYIGKYIYDIKIGNDESCQILHCVSYLSKNYSSDLKLELIAAIRKYHGEKEVSRKISDRYVWLLNHYETISKNANFEDRIDFECINNGNCCTVRIKN